jgi:hypothetical protein
MTQKPQLSSFLLNSLVSIEGRLVPPFRQLFVNADGAAGPPAETISLTMASAEIRTEGQRVNGRRVTS